MMSVGRGSEEAAVTTPRDDELTALLEAGESDRVEFKEALTGGAARAIREAICAFANDLPGHGLPGAVFVGVRDAGSATGLPVTDELPRQLADMKTDGNIVPPPSIAVRRLTLASGDAAVVTVSPSDSPPVRYRGAVDYRNPNLAEALRRLGFVQRFGVGIATAQRLLSEAGHPPATFQVTDSSVLVTLPAIADATQAPP